MTNPDSWMRIKRVAEERRDTSARGLARLMTRARDSRQQLQLLLDYRLDYRARFDSASRTGMRGEWLRNYQTFLANLEQAIALQTAALKGLEDEVAVAQARLNGEQRRAESYQIIDDRRSSASLTREQRQQQRLQDEMASRVLAQLGPSGSC